MIGVAHPVHATPDYRTCVHSPFASVSAVFFEQLEPSRAHGQEERIGVKAFHDGVAFWYSTVKQLGTNRITP